MEALGARVGNRRSGEKKNEETNKKRAAAFTWQAATKAGLRRGRFLCGSFL